RASDDHAPGVMVGKPGSSPPCTPPPEEDEVDFFAASGATASRADMPEPDAPPATLGDLAAVGRLPDEVVRTSTPPPVAIVPSPPPVARGAAEELRRAQTPPP